MICDVVSGRKRDLRRKLATNEGNSCGDDGRSKLTRLSTMRRSIFGSAESIGELRLWQQ